MVLLSVPRSMMAIIVQEHVLVAAVGCECHSRDAQPWKRAPEAVEPRENALVPPCLAASHGDMLC